MSLLETVQAPRRTRQESSGFPPCQRQSLSLSLKQTNPMSLTTQDVAHIAKLSRLHLSEEEMETYRTQLDSILTYIEKLQAVDTTGVPELQHALPISNVFREDVVAVCESDVHAQLIENFSQKEGDLLEVQAVFNRE